MTRVLDGDFDLVDAINAKAKPRAQQSTCACGAPILKSRRQSMCLDCSYEAAQKRRRERQRRRPERRS